MNACVIKVGAKAAISRGATAEEYIFYFEAILYASYSFKEHFNVIVVLITGY